MCHHRREGQVHGEKRADGQTHPHRAVSGLPETQLADDHHPRRDQPHAPAQGREPETRRGDHRGEAEDRRGHHLVRHRPHHPRQPAVAQRERHHHAAAWRQDRELHPHGRPPHGSPQRHHRERQRLVWHRRRGGWHAPGQQCRDRRDHRFVDTHGERLGYRERGDCHRCAVGRVWRPFQWCGEGEHPQGQVAFHRRGENQPAHPPGVAQQRVRPGWPSGTAQRLDRARPLVLGCRLAPYRLPAQHPLAALLQHLHACHHAAHPESRTHRQPGWLQFGERPRRGPRRLPQGARQHAARPLQPAVAAQQVVDHQPRDERLAGLLRPQERELCQQVERLDPTLYPLARGRLRHRTGIRRAARCRHHPRSHRLLVCEGIQRLTAHELVAETEE